MKSPLDGWPKTIPIERDGQQGFFIMAHYLSPGRSKAFWHFTRYIAPFLTIWMILFAFGQADRYDPTSPLAIFYIALIIVVGGGFALVWNYDTPRNWLAQKLLSQKVQITFYGRTVNINGHDYSLDVPHSFEMFPHDRAFEEEQSAPVDLEKHKRILLFYRIARHVVLRYAKQRIDIAEFSSEKRAEQLVMRLQLVDALMHGMQGQEREQRRENEQRRRQEEGKRQHEHRRRNKDRASYGHNGGESKQDVDDFIRQVKGNK